MSYQGSGIEGLFLPSQKLDPSNGESHGENADSGCYQYEQSAVYFDNDDLQVSC